MRILLVDDEERFIAALAESVKAEGYAVDVVLNGTDAIEYAVRYPYDLMVLDIMLPGLNGTQVLNKIREKNREVPVLMLTARDMVEDKVKHFDAGADDYLTKPFSYAEFMVRVRALLRRRATQQTDIIQIKDFELNRQTRRVKRGDKRLEISGKEYALLEYLALNSNRVMSRSMIIEHVWDQAFDSLTNIVDVYIRQLRSKIDEGFDVKLIHTIRGAGYLFGDQEA